MIKKGTRERRGFTLVEIMIVIAIIGILSVGISNIDWNRLSDRQKSTIFKNRVVSHIETVRNNALFGKAVTNNLVVPDIWKISVGTGSIVTEYSTGAGVFHTYEPNTIGLQRFETISGITCQGTPITDTGSIIIQGAEMSLSGSCLATDQILEFELGYKDPIFNERISINIVNGLVQDID